VLEGANIKLASVATAILGQSGHDMLVALVSGTSDAAALAQLARGRLREQIPQLEEALTGQFGPQQRFLIAQQLAHIDFLAASLERVSAAIGERLRPFEPEVERLPTIPGVGRRTAQVLLAEIGPDLSRFPSAGHLASWAGLCPGNDESAGKRRSGRTRKGSPWLRTALVEAAQAAARTKDTYLVGVSQGQDDDPACRDGVACERERLVHAPHQHGGRRMQAQRLLDHGIEVGHRAQIRQGHRHVVSDVTWGLGIFSGTSPTRVCQSRSR
jgi:hypothetical protein